MRQALVGHGHKLIGWKLSFPTSPVLTISGAVLLAEFGFGLLMPLQEIPLYMMVHM